MSRQTYFTISCSLALTLMSQVIAQNVVEQFVAETILHLNWGDGHNEIGYSETLVGYEDKHGGPVCFDVDRDGNIYILDTVKSYIKIFGQSGELLECFALEHSGREYGYIAVDEKSKNIWHHNPWNRTFSEYTFDGSLLKTVIYNEQSVSIIPPQFDIWDGQIISGGKVVISEIASRFGSRGEPIHEGTIKWIRSRNERFNMNSSEHSRRAYVRLEPELAGNNEQSRPRMLIIDEIGNEDTLVFSEMSRLYHVSFLAEDKHGYLYCLFTYRGIERSSQIRKYDSRMNLVAKIDSFPSNRDFNFLMTEHLVDENGNVYFMHLSRELGVRVIKWHGG